MYLWILTLPLQFYINNVISATVIKKDGMKETSINEKNLMNFTCDMYRYVPEESNISSNVAFSFLTNFTQKYNVPEHMKIMKNNCDKFIYESNEYRILPNNSVMVCDEIITPGFYEFHNTTLIVCETDYDSTHYWNDFYNRVVILVGQICTIISVLFLFIHLCVFFQVARMRNIPGYCIAALSFSLLLAYVFLLIGQIPEVLGISCIISGVFQHYFFLAAFFWMNVVAYDIWKMLKMVTQKLRKASEISERRFLWYNIYAWSISLVITIASVTVDNLPMVPEDFKPGYGHNDSCFITHAKASTIFYRAPAFTLFLCNVVFFSLSAYLIFSAKMDHKNDEHKEMKFNYILYLKLGVVMGLTWSLGIIANFLDDRVLWVAFDLLNSLQGLFVFILFTCTKKVGSHFKRKISKIAKIKSAEKTSTESEDTNL